MLNKAFTDYAAKVNQKVVTETETIDYCVESVEIMYTVVE